MTSNSIPNNPAGRLLAICRRFQGFQNGQSMGVAWGQILQVPENDTPALLWKISLVASLIDSTKRKIQSIDEINQALYLKWEQPVRQALGNLNLNGGRMDVIKSVITEDVITALEFCDDRLKVDMPEKTVDLDVLNTLLEDVRNLVGKILVADLPDDIRAFLLEKLDTLERALDMYSVLGIEPIGNAVDSIWGGTIRNGGETFYKSIKDIEVGDEVWKVAGRATALVTLVESAYKYLPFLKDYLR